MSLSQLRGRIFRGWNWRVDESIIRICHILPRDIELNRFDLVSSLCHIAAHSGIGFSGSHLQYHVSKLSANN